jgi:hypothetical protein
MYEINTQGLEPQEIRDLAQRMITVLRRRIDPANIQNLIWRAIGDRRWIVRAMNGAQGVREASSRPCGRWGRR